VLLVFIGLESSELAVARVIQRVDTGGHDVPDAKIRSRFPRTFENLTQALEFVDHAFVLDNSSADDPFRFVAEFGDGTLVRRGTNRPTWAIPLCETLPKKRR
jgi:predicted ABC-type ATPase